MQYLNLPVSQACPVCNQARCQVLYEVTAAGSARHFSFACWHNPNQPQRLAQLEDKIAALWKSQKCRVVRCLTCDFVFSDPYVSGDAAFYNLAFDDGYPGDKWEFQKTLEVISTAYPDKSFRLFEAGAGMGHFAQKVAPLIRDKRNISVTEYSEKALAHLRTCGYQVFSRDIRDLTREQPELHRQYDVVCLFQVAEHMDRLHELFQAVSVLLKSGGLLFVAVPNPARIQFNEWNEGWLDMPPNHISRFSEKSFRLLGERNGFSLVQVASEPESMRSLMGSLFHQRSNQRQQEGKPQRGNRWLAALKFPWIRQKARWAGTPGVGYWAYFQLQNK